LKHLIDIVNGNFLEEQNSGYLVLRTDQDIARYFLIPSGVFWDQSPLNILEPLEKGMNKDKFAENSPI
jgi:hypothetical protein